MKGKWKMSASRRLLEKKSVFPEIFSAVFLRSPCDSTFLSATRNACAITKRLSHVREKMRKIFSRKNINKVRKARCERRRWCLFVNREKSEHYASARVVNKTSWRRHVGTSPCAFFSSLFVLSIQQSFEFTLTTAFVKFKGFKAIYFILYWRK